MLCVVNGNEAAVVMVCTPAAMISLPSATRQGRSVFFETNFQWSAALELHTPMPYVHCECDIMEQRLIIHQHTVISERAH